MSALDTGRRDGRVWYASYGSNLLAERFGYYLSGGALPGQEVGHIGARDSTPARASATWAVSWARFTFAPCAPSSRRPPRMGCPHAPITA